VYDRSTIIVKPRINGWKQLSLSLTRLRKERCSLTSQNLSCWIQMGIHSKRNENNEVLRYKARPVTQGFIQRPDINFNETYSPVMNGMTF
jgi:hypothetical protein